MALSGSRLQTALAGDILTQLQANFPVSASLLPAEKTLMNNAMTQLANSIAAGTGPDVVTEITTHAVVPLGILVAVTGNATAQAGATTGPGTVT